MQWYPSSSDSDCLRHNADGHPYEEFTCLYPLYGKLYNTAEVEFNPGTVFYWMKDKPLVPLAAILTYAIWIVQGSRYFARNKAWDMRSTMALWNLGLSVFSFIGFTRTFPQLLHNYTNYSMKENFCFNPESSYGSGSTGMWVQFFILSKIPELLDTFFIVVHKKPLIFLHWYHHISVLAYCWHSYVTRAPHGLIFCAMNYCVHAIMYFYYFLMAVKLKPKAFKALYITMAQISQMIVGVAVTTTGCYYLWADDTYDTNSCYLSKENNIAALGMYGSYLFLFLQFFFQRYSGKRTSATGGKVLKTA